VSGKTITFDSEEHKTTPSKGNESELLLISSGIVCSYLFIFFNGRLSRLEVVIDLNAITFVCRVRLRT